MPINAPLDERSFWGKLCSELNADSVGALHRAMLLAGLAVVAPEKADELREIRRRYYGAAFLFIICFSVAASWVYGDDDSMRRARTMRVRTVRCSRTGENKIETEFV